MLHRGYVAFTKAKLLCMAALASVAAATAVAGIGAVFAGQGLETLERTNYSEGVRADEQESARTCLFSFGLERGARSYARPMAQTAAQLIRERNYLTHSVVAGYQDAGWSFSCVASRGLACTTYRIELAD